MNSLEPLWPVADQLCPPQTDELHIFAVNIASARTRLDRLLSCFSSDEVDRAARFRIAAPRERFVAARAALRAILSACLGVAAEQIVFASDRFGKPVLSTGKYPQRLTFNVSHSGELALIAVSETTEVGIDVECGRSVRCRNGIAERFFHPQEVAQINDLPEAERDAAFFRCWTRKEAILKAIGTGLQYPLDAFCVSVADDVADWVELPARDPHPARRCWLENLAPCHGYAAAVATVERQPSCRRSVFQL